MTDSLLNQMIKLNIIDDSEIEIYRFGLEGLILKIIHYTTYLFIAIFLRELIGFLIFFAAFLLLRRNAGGYHAKTKGVCYISSCLTVFVAVMCMKMIPEWQEIRVIGAIPVITADAIICSIAPLGNRNRVLDQEETKHYRKRCICFLMIENVLIIICIALRGWHYAVPIVIAVVCEAILLLLEKSRKGNNKIEIR